MFISHLHLSLQLSPLPLALIPLTIGPREHACSMLLVSHILPFKVVAILVQMLATSMHQVIKEFSLVYAAVTLLGKAIPASVTVLE